MTTLIYLPNVRNQTAMEMHPSEDLSKPNRINTINRDLNVSTESNLRPPQVNSTQDTIDRAKENEQSCLDLLDKCTSQLACAKSLNRYRALCTPRSCEKLR